MERDAIAQKYFRQALRIGNENRLAEVSPRALEGIALATFYGGDMGLARQSYEDALAVRIRAPRGNASESVGVADSIGVDRVYARQTGRGRAILVAFTCRRPAHSGFAAPGRGRDTEDDCTTAGPGAAQLVPRGNGWRTRCPSTQPSKAKRTKAGSWPGPTSHSPISGSAGSTSRNRCCSGRSAWPSPRSMSWKVPSSRTWPTWNARPARGHGIGATSNPHTLLAKHYPDDPVAHSAHRQCACGMPSADRTRGRSRTPDHRSLPRADREMEPRHVPTGTMRCSGQSRAYTLTGNHTRLTELAMR